MTETIATMSTFDMSINLMTIGDSGVGKSNIIARFTDNKFSTSHLTTLGIDFKSKTLEHEGKIVKLKIWDTAGQERFKAIGHNYYRNAQGLLLVYDITDRGSFDHVSKWMDDIHTYANSTVKIVLVGNKCDAEEGRVEVSEEEGKALANQYKIPFIQTSAMENINVTEAFSILIGLVKESQDSKMRKPSSSNLVVVDSKKQSRSCCTSS